MDKITYNYFEETHIDEFILQLLKSSISYIGSIISKKSAISGKISRYSTEYAFLISKIANEDHLNINFDTLTELPFVDITNISIKPKATTLVETPWCASTDYDDPYIVRYCQFDNESELCRYIDELNKTQNITAYFDEIRKPKQNMHTLKNFMN